MTVDKKDIERSFYNTASEALEAIGTSATDFFGQHPDHSKKELAQLIGRGVTARGLTMKLFEEARRDSTVLDLVKSLLYRRILTEYPNGWYYDEKISTTVKLGRWYSDVVEFAPEYEDSAASVVRSLAGTSRPKPGWKPTSADDKQIRLIFEENWTEPA